MDRAPGAQYTRVRVYGCYLAGLWNVPSWFAGRIRGSRAAQGVRKEGLGEADSRYSKPQLSSVSLGKFPHPANLCFPICDREWCCWLMEGPRPSQWVAKSPRCAGCPVLGQTHSWPRSALGASHHQGPIGFSSFLFCKFPLHYDDVWNIRPVSTETRRRHRADGSGPSQERVLWR